MPCPAELAILPLKLCLSADWPSALPHKPHLSLGSCGYMRTKGHGLSLLLPLSTCLFKFFLEQISRPLAQKHVQPGLEVHFFVCQEQGSSVANTQKAKQGQDVTGACCALSTSLLCNKHLQRAHSNSAALAMLRAVLHLVSVVAHIGSFSTSSSKLLYLAPHGS